jgi:tRNA(fMet)-specific endonuclease VapC
VTSAEAKPAFLLDTNILVYLIDGSSDTLRQNIERHAPGSLATSALCVAEAMFGLKGNEHASNMLERLLAHVKPLPFDLAAAQTFPRIPFGRGKLDRFIAAHAIALELILVTNNEADFADLPNLKIENWTMV